MQKELESLWQKCVAFHGHGCGGLAVGFRAVLYAWELFESDSTSEDEEIVCIMLLSLSFYLISLYFEHRQAAIQEK